MDHIPIRLVAVFSRRATGLVFVQFKSSSSPVDLRQPDNNLDN